MHGHVPLLLLSCLNIMLELCAAAHCAQHLVMHVCLIHGYVCCTSVQDAIYIYIQILWYYITAKVTTRCFGLLIQIVNQVLCLSDSECTLYFSKRGQRRHRTQAIPQTRGTKIKGLAIMNSYCKLQMNDQNSRLFLYACCLPDCL